MQKTTRIVMMLVIGGAFAASADAHHGTTASYDQTRLITERGVVVEFVWANPHCQIYFDVKDKDGNVSHWGSELHSPTLLKERGWDKDVLKPGDEITVIGHPARSANPIIEIFSVKDVTTGKVYYRELPGTPGAIPGAYQEPGR